MTRRYGDIVGDGAAEAVGDPEEDATGEGDGVGVVPGGNVNP